MATDGADSPLTLSEEDAMKMVVCEAHIGTTNVDYQGTQYVWKRRSDGVHIINVKKTWDKLYLAARAIAAVENPADVCVITARTYAQRALLKFAAHTGATPIFGRFTPGSLTNQIQNFKEPRLIVISDPRVDHQAVTEASYVNIPVIGFTNTDSPLKFIDIAIPCNTKGQYSIGLMWWLLAREVLVIRGKITRQTGFVIDDKVIMPDLYFYRDPLEVQEKEEIEQADHGHEQAWTATHDVKDEAPMVAAGDEMKLDFQVPRIDDWGAASTWEQPAPAAATGTAAPTDEWGAGGTSW